jgi:hypothetical protein
MVIVQPHRAPYSHMERLSAIPISMYGAGSSMNGYANLHLAGRIASDIGR